MLLKGIKNYIVNLKYVFTPLGTLFLGVVIGLSVLIPSLISSVEYVVKEVSALVESTSLDLYAMWNCFLTEVGKLNWSEPFSAIQTVLNTEWLRTTFFSCINALVGDVESYRAAITDIIHNAVNIVKSGTVAFLVWTAAGFIGGYFLTKYLVRRNVAKRALWKFLLVAFLGALLSATLVATCLVMISNLKLGGLWSFMLTFMLAGFVSLFEAYVVHGNKQIKPREIINIFNIARLFLSDLIILGVSLLFCFVAGVIIKGPVLLFICLPLIEIALIVISMNAESYVKSVAEKKKALNKGATAKTAVVAKEKYHGELIYGKKADAVEQSDLDLTSVYAQSSLVFPPDNSDSIVKNNNVNTFAENAVETSGEKDAVTHAVKNHVQDKGKAQNNVKRGNKEGKAASINKSAVGKTSGALKDDGKSNGGTKSIAEKTGKSADVTVKTTVKKNASRAREKSPGKN